MNVIDNTVMTVSASEYPKPQNSLFLMIGPLRPNTCMLPDLGRIYFLHCA